MACFVAVCVVLCIRLRVVQPHGVVKELDRPPTEFAGGWPSSTSRSGRNKKTIHLPSTPILTPTVRAVTRQLPSAAPPEPPRLDLYALSLSYMDQMSSAAARLKSLQCWATTWKPLYEHIGVVEPFVTDGAHLGVPIDVHRSVHVNKTLKFSDLFDIDTWDSQGKRKGIKYPELVSWSDFLNYAPRNVVAVQIVYDYDYRCTENELTEPTCGSARLNATLSQVFRPHNFTIMNRVCIDFKSLGVLSIEDFNHRIFNPIPKHTPITVVFDEWRGPGNTYKCFVRIADPVCLPVVCVQELSKTILMPSSNIKSQADAYISRYLNEKLKYIAVLIRWEKLLLSQLFGANYRPSSGVTCVKKVLNIVKTLYSERGLNTTFLTTDIGKFGSSTFGLLNMTRTSVVNFTSYTEDLLRELSDNETISLSDYEQRFEDIGSTTNPALVSQLQKAIAANARCLVLVGWGRFHENLLQMYKKKYSREEECLKFIRSC